MQSGAGRKKKWFMKQQSACRKARASITVRMMQVKAFVGHLFAVVAALVTAVAAQRVVAAYGKSQPATREFKFTFM